MAEVNTTTSDSRWKNTRYWVQVVVVVFVALSGAYQFVFKDIIRPSREPTALELSTGLENVGKKGGMVLVRARITAVNPTNRRIYVPAFWFNVRAVRLFSAAHQVEADQKSGTLDPDRLVTAYAQIASRELIAYQRIVTAGNAWWDPKDKTHDEAVFAVPEGKFDYLEMRVTYLHTRFGDVLLEPDWIQDAEGEWTAMFRLKPGLFGKRDPYKWQEKTGSGQNWSVATLPLWREPTVK